MKRSIVKKGVAALCALALSVPVATHSQVEMKPRQVGAAIDFGEIKEGKVNDGDWSDQALTRTGVYMTTSGTYDKRLEISITIGGLFWYPLSPGESSPERLVRFGPGVGQAQGVYSFGNPENPFGKLQFGLFPVKYNPDATNLGEYLYRSGTYPGYLLTGGWSYINSASYLAQGARFSLPTFGGKVIHDFTLFMERDFEPTSDFTPGYLLTVKPVPFLELGAGVVWAHAISFYPSRLSPKSRINSYDKTTDLPLTQTDRDLRGYTYYGPGDSRNDPHIVGATDPRARKYLDDLGTVNDAHQDSEGLTYVIADPAGIPADSLYKFEFNGTPRNNLDYYTFRGFKAMGRVSFDVGSLLKVDRIRPGDFRLYSEIALLGIEDQPYYYDDKSERMPIMAGISIPTFGLLDKLAIEGEYHKSRFPNTVGAPFYESLPLPLNGQGSNPFDYSDSAVAADGKKFKKDDWHWSIYASRKITQGITVFAQAASDHQRHPNGPEVKPTLEPPTLEASDWYYVVRLDFGLF